MGEGGGVSRGQAGGVVQEVCPCLWWCPVQLACTVLRFCSYLFRRTSLVVQAVKNLPAMQEIWVKSLGWEGPLEKGWQPTPVCLPGEFHGQRSLVGYSPQGHKESDMIEQPNT